MEKNKLADVSMGLWCPVCAVAAFYRGPEVGQAKLELVGGLAGGRPSQSQCKHILGECLHGQEEESFKMRKATAESVFLFLAPRPLCAYYS